MITRPKITRSNTRIVRLPQNANNNGPVVISIPEVNGVHKEAVEALKEIKIIKTKLETDVNNLIKKAEYQIRVIKKGDPGIQGKQGPKGDKGESIQGPKGDTGRDADNNAIFEKLWKFAEAKIASIIPTISDLYEQILSLINKKKLPISTIEGLQDKLRTIDSRIALGSGARGGMGTIKYFKFTGDGVTTAFTLPDVPTQEGNAVFAFYEGQRVHPNDHYTVSGTTLNMVTAPADDAIIDGWIIT